MIGIPVPRLHEILNRGEGRRILVVGDLMIDRYLWGQVSRISPEAPVPIINIQDEEVRFGGAANVANNLIGLNAVPVIVGVVGDDNWGEVFRQQLLRNKLPAGGLVVHPGRPTTIKTRIIGNNQHIARVDREHTHPIEKSTQHKILDFVESTMPEVDAVILEDYNKGLLLPELIRQIVTCANRHGKIVTVDPKFDHFLDYRDVTLFKPNRKETAEALAMRVDDQAQIRRAGAILLEKLNAKYVLITLGSQGMALFEQNGAVRFTDTRARKVADVSGAGDTVIGTVTFALAAGATILEAVSMATFAAGVVCEEVGVVPITAPKLLQSMTAAAE